MTNKLGWKENPSPLSLPRVPTHPGSRPRVLTIPENRPAW